MITTVTVTATEDTPLSAVAFTVTRQPSENLADFLQRIRELIIFVTMEKELRRT